ncbi:MAG: signal peptidase II [Firmicutes bacterium]|nr:signal peptidase II [Bacillota bacterium]MDY5532010.1 signal peptidase II [Pumilibacteraceae bacterium]
MKGSFFISTWKYLKSAWRELVTIVAVLVVDLVSKSIVEKNMTEGQTLTLIPGLFSFRFSYNDKAAYSMAFGLEKVLTQDQIITFFIITTIIALLAFSFVLWWLRSRNLISRIAIALIIGGAIGNLVDRIAIRKVRDFLCLTVFGKEIFGSFNVADAALSIGVVLVAVYLIFFFDKDEEKLKKLKASAAVASGEQIAEPVPKPLASDVPSGDESQADNRQSDEQNEAQNNSDEQPDRAKQEEQVQNGNDSDA